MGGAAAIGETSVVVCSISSKRISHWGGEFVCKGPTGKAELVGDKGGVKSYSDEVVRLRVGNPKSMHLEGRLSLGSVLSGRLRPAGSSNLLSFVLL